MGFFSGAFPLEQEEAMRKLTFLRLVVATVIIGAAITTFQFDENTISVVALYSLLGVTYLATGSVYLAFRSGAPFKVLMWLLIVVDIAVLTMMAHYSGGWASYFTILFVLPIIAGGQYFHVSGGLITAILASSVYIGYTFLELGGSIRPPAEGWAIVDSGSNFFSPLLRGYINLVIFFFAGLLSGYVSRHIKNKGEELADKEMEIRRIQLSTDSILTNMSSGLIVTDMDGEVLSVNPAAVAILGIDTRIDPKGRTINEILPGMPSLVEELGRVISSGRQKQRHEIEVIKDDGKVLPLGISISLLLDEYHEKRGIIAIFQDLTEVQRMREKMRQSDKMAAVGELSAAIAHEVRAPLASICGSIEMLKGELELSGDNARLMDLIIRESDRLDRIISDFLEFARMRKPSFSRVDIEKCLGEMILLLKHTPVLGHKSSIDLKCRADGVRIQADDEQIRQVFLNLGINGCEAIRKNGNLTIDVSKVSARLFEEGRSEDCVQIDFHNDGPAIPDDVLPHVFEPFFTTKQGGTGLGLAIAARIVESHSGTIKVNSSKERGTVFSVVLPVSCKEEIHDEEMLQVEAGGF